MADLENTLYLDLEKGRVVIEMLPDVAPGHVKHIKELAREGLLRITQQAAFSPIYLQINRHVD